MDWFRDKGGTTTVDYDVAVRAGVPESLGRRTIQSMKTLDLIDDSGKPTQQFLDLAQVRGEDEYRSRLVEWLRAEYADVLKYCDPSTDAYDRIVEAFRGYEPRGQRRGMASLMLGLWKHAGLPVVASPATTKDARRPSRMPSSATSKSTMSTPSTSKSTRSRLAGANGGREALSTDGLPPGLVGLLHQIPRDGAAWTAETRDNFIQAFTAVLNFSVKIGDPQEELDEEQGVNEV
jgi:hypothetical protein